MPTSDIQRNTYGVVRGASDATNAAAIGLDTVSGQVKVNDNGTIKTMVDDTNAQTVGGAKTFTSQVIAGIGGQTATQGKVAVHLADFFSSAGVGNGADATDDTLWTFNIPAGAFSGANQRIQITLTGSVAANADTKTLKVKVGSSISLTLNGTTTAPNGKKFTAYVEIVRSGSNTQAAWSECSFDGVAQEPATFNTSGSETEANAIAVTVTGASGSSAANDVLLKSGCAVFLG